jgi:hypothetical protein
MSVDHTPQTGPALGSTSSVALDRRRLLRGGLAGAPLLLTLASKPVSATTCTQASSFASINMSRPDRAYSCSGRTPGYWKQEGKFWDWPLPAYCPSANTVAGNGTAQPVYNPPLNATPTKFNDVFGAAGGYPDKTLLDVLKMPGNDLGRDALARHIVAAVLNAADGITPATVLSESAVKNIWASFVAKGYYEPTAGIKWYADYAEPASPTGGLIAWLKTTMPV